jgi:hypothetical protein
MYDLSKGPVATTPFVQTTDGNRIAAGKVEKTKKEIIADDKAYKQKEVSFYGDGKKAYANVGGTSFAPQIAAGKINVYQSSYTTTTYDPGFGNVPGRLKTSNHQRWYIQDSSANTVSFFGYKSLKSLVPANSAAGAIIKDYKKSRVISNITLGAGFGVFIAGAAMAGGAVLNDKSDAKINAGLYTMMGGAGIMTYSFVIKGRNRGKLIKAINVHNGRQK